MNNKMKTAILSAVITMTTMGVFANPVVIGNHSVAIGNGVSANEDNSIALGNGVINTNNNTIGIGNGVTADTNAIAIGNGASASNINTIAIGNGVNANSTTSIAIGYGLTTDGVDSVNIGNINKGSNKESVLLGFHNVVEHNDHLETPEGDTLIGSTNVVRDGYHGITIGKDNEINHANYGVAIGNKASVMQDESIAIGHNSLANTVKATTGMIINGTTYNLSGINPVGTVSIGNTGKERTITNVAAGRVIDGSTDAVNGSQLLAAINEINTNGSKINTVTSRVVDNSTRLDSLENTTRDINTTVNNTAAQVNINTKDISDLKGKVGASNVLKQQMENKINQLERGTNQGIASVAALSSLHWNGFDAHNKLAFSAGFGHYKNANAGALGAFYAPNENVMFYVGQSFGSSSVTNASVNFKVGKTTNVKRDEVKDLKERVEMLENLLTK